MIAHINNLQNTSFWALVHSGLSTKEANQALSVSLQPVTRLTRQGTDSKQKNELLFSRFGINYNNIEPMFRKGSTLVRLDPSAASQGSEGVMEEGRKTKKVKPFEGITGEIVVLHEDIIGDAFWSHRPWLLR